MPLETGTYISDLNVSNPLSSDDSKQGDDHLRLIKNTIKNTFPNITGAVTPTHTELNYVDGATSNIQAQLDSLSSGAYDPRTKPLFSTDFLGAGLLDNHPFKGEIYPSATLVVPITTPNHPGVIQSPNPVLTPGYSGHSFTLTEDCIFPQGSNTFEIILKFIEAPNSIYVGFLSEASLVGVFNEGVSVPKAFLKFTGTTATAFVGDGIANTTSAALTGISTGVWYKAIITANAGHTAYTFEIYNSTSGILVATTTLSTNLPTTPLDAGYAQKGGTYVQVDYMAVSLGGTTGLSR